MKLSIILRRMIPLQRIRYRNNKKKGKFGLELLLFFKDILFFSRLFSWSAIFVMDFNFFDSTQICKELQFLDGLSCEYIFQMNNQSN